MYTVLLQQDVEQMLTGRIYWFDQTRKTYRNGTWIYGACNEIHICHRTRFCNKKKKIVKKFMGNVWTCSLTCYNSRDAFMYFIYTIRISHNLVFMTILLVQIHNIRLIILYTKEYFYICKKCYTRKLLYSDYSASDGLWLSTWTNIKNV